MADITDTIFKTPGGQQGGGWTELFKHVPEIIQLVTALRNGGTAQGVIDGAQNLAGKTTDLGAALGNFRGILDKMGLGNKPIGEILAGLSPLTPNQLAELVRNFNQTKELPGGNQSGS